MDGLLMLAEAAYTQDWVPGRPHHKHTMRSGTKRSQQEMMSWASWQSEQTPHKRKSIAEVATDDEQPSPPSTCAQTVLSVTQEPIQGTVPEAPEVSLQIWNDGDFESDADSSASSLASMSSSESEDECFTLTTCTEDRPKPDKVFSFWPQR